MKNAMRVASIDDSIEKKEQASNQTQTIHSTKARGRLPKTWEDFHASKKTHSVISRADPKDISIIKEWENRAIRSLKQTSSKDNEEALRFLFDTFLYYENIGDSTKSLKVCENILCFSQASKNSHVARRAHNILSVGYARVSDFSISFRHAELAIKIALKADEPLGILASVANTAVILDSAGLTYAAKCLTTRAAQLASDGAVSDYLTFINSNNGLRISHRDNDIESAHRFFETSREKFPTQEKTITEVTRAYYKSAESDHLIAIGKAKLASDSLKSEIQRAAAQKNVRVAALLHCASARAHLATQNLRGIEKSRKTLSDYLRKTELPPLHYEECLQTLIRLYVDVHGEMQSIQLEKLQRSLRHFIVTTRYKNFFGAIAKRYKHGVSLTPDLESPHYDTPDWIFNEGIVFFDKIAIANQESLTFKKRNSFYSTSKSDVRSFEYDVAEDWAVAADFASGEKGDHCFGVGELVRLMAIELQCSVSESAKLGRAARLHDIGKITHVAFGDEAASTHGEIVRHTELGAALLGRSSDPIFESACRIAGGHHEWWNGAGMPNGRRGVEIPLEARMCAVADCFLEFVQPTAGRRAWRQSDAIDQLRCMAGVQLDPILVESLIRILKEGGDDSFIEGEVNERSAEESLAQARRRLFRVLELVP